VPRFPSTGVKPGEGTRGRAVKAAKAGVGFRSFGTFEKWCREFDVCAPF
jgi:hypothetical protein